MKPNRNHFFKLSLLVICTFSLQAQATTTLNWRGGTFGGNSFLTTSSNWLENESPSASTDLVIATRNGTGHIPVLLFASNDYSVRSISADNTDSRFNPTTGLRLAPTTTDGSDVVRSISFDTSSIRLWSATNNTNLRFIRWTSTATLNLNLNYSGFSEVYVDGSSRIGVETATLNGSGGLEKTGAGVFSIERAGTFTGGVRILEGVLSVDAPGGLGAAPTSFVANQVFIDGGTLRFNNSSVGSATNRGFQIGLSGGTIEVLVSDISIFGVISGGGQITKTGDSTLGFNAANTFSGGTLIADGRASFNNSSSFGSGLITMENGTGIYASIVGTSISNDMLLKGNSRFGNSFTAVQSYDGNINLNGATRDIQISSQVTFGGTVSNGGLAIDVDPNAKLTLSGSNSHTGPTTIKSGVVALGAAGSFDHSPLITVNGTLDTSAKSSFTILGTQTLAGNGTVILGTGNELNVASGGILAAGNSPGELTFSGGTTTLDAGSIFSWELNDNVDSTTGTRGVGGNYDGLTTTDSGNLVVSPGAIFRVVLTAAVDRGNEFWNITRSWNNIFKIAGTTTVADLANGHLFDTIQVMDGTSGSLFTPANGSFSFNGSTLMWSAVPEPTTALAGVLMGAGLLRRRRAA